MKLIKKLKEKVSDSYKQDFIVEHIDLLDYKLNDIYNDLITKKFREDYPDFYLETRYNEFIVDSAKFKISIDSTYEDIVKAFEKAVGSGDSRENAKLKAKFNYSCGRFRNEGNGNLLEYRSYGMNSLDSLLFILTWVIDDVIPPDLGEAQDWMREKGLSSNSVMFKETFEELGVEITSQKNGKIKIRGLDSNELERLDFLFEICERK